MNIGEAAGRLLSFDITPGFNIKNVSNNGSKGWGLNGGGMIGPTGGVSGIMGL